MELNLKNSNFVHLFISKKLEKKIGSANEDSRKDVLVKQAMTKKRTGSVDSEADTTDEDDHSPSNDVKSNPQTSKINSNRRLVNKIALQTESDNEDEEDDVLVLKRKHNKEAEEKMAEVVSTLFSNLSEHSISSNSGLKQQDTTHKLKDVVTLVNLKAC